jgi:hypothetical protein
VTAATDPFEHADAAYVLGALGHEDRVAYEEHLQICDRCTASVAELAVLPALLARLPAMPAADGARDQLPATVLPGLRTELRRVRARRRLLGAAASVAAAAVLVGGTVTVVDRTTGTPEASGEAVDMVGDVPVHADVHLAGAPWGTRITMICRYEGPEPSEPATPVSYQLVVVAANDGGTQSVARWQSLPGRDAQVAGSTDLPVDQIASVQLLDANGKLLLQGSP